MRDRLPWLCSLVAVLMLLCLGIPCGAVAAHADSASSSIPGEVVVKLHPGVNIGAVASKYGLQPQPKDKLSGHPIYRMWIVDGTAPSPKAANLAADPRVIYAEPNYEGQAPETRQRSSWTVGGDAGAYSQQWASDMLRLPEAHTVTQGTNITVAVLDTGADLNHPALAGRIVSGFDFVDNDTDPSESGVYGQDHGYGHGTHVAGLVAFAAPAAKIMPLRTLQPDGMGTIWTQAEAVRYALDHGADVINLSFSFAAPSKLIDDILAEVTCTPAVDTDCHSGVRPGAVVVAAAGNGGVAIREYPAASLVPGVMGVAASTESDTLANFSNSGVWVEVAAPGERILSSVPDGQYASWSGTSMSTALAAGTAALVRATYPRMRPAQVALHITTTAAFISGPAKRRVDAAAAVGLPAPVRKP
jgi:thermitase